MKVIAGALGLVVALTLTVAAGPMSSNSDSSSSTSGATEEDQPQEDQSQKDQSQKDQSQKDQSVTPPDTRGKTPEEYAFPSVPWTT
jgi:cytoskeletal protein RodZ